MQVTVSLRTKILEYFEISRPRNLGYFEASRLKYNLRSLDDVIANLALLLMVLPKRACYPTTYILIVHTYHSLLLYSTIFPLAELYHQRQAPQTFYPHPGVIPNSMSHGNIIRSHCSTFVSGSAAAAAAATSSVTGGLGGSNSEIMALNASMLTSTNGNNGSNNTTTDFGVGVPTLMQQPHASILRSSVDNLLSQQHPMMVISFQIFFKKTFILLLSMEEEDSTVE